MLERKKLSNLGEEEPGDSSGHVGVLALQASFGNAALLELLQGGPAPSCVRREVTVLPPSDPIDPREKGGTPPANPNPNVSHADALTQHEIQIARLLGMDSGAIGAVRIHTGEQAQAVTASVGAPAVASGPRDIHLASPNHRKYEDLIAHEIAHLVQQGPALERDPDARRRGPSRRGLAVKDPESDAQEAAEAVLSGKAYVPGFVPRGKYGFGATMPKVDEEADEDTQVNKLAATPKYDESAPTHEGQTLEAARKAGFSGKEAKILYKGNWERDLNQIMIPFTAEAYQSLYTLLEILHLAHFGEKLSSPDKLGVYRAVEHNDNPANLCGTNVIGPAPDQAVYDYDPIYAQAYPLVDQASVMNPKDPFAFHVDESGLPAYLLAGREHVKERLAAAFEKDPVDLSIVGEALHTLQDYFAHTNIVEIMVNLRMKGSGKSVDTFVHAVNAEGEKSSENLTTPEGREVVQSGTFLTEDTVHSVVAKFADALSANPYASSKGPNEMGIALLQWLQSNPVFMGEKANQIVQTLLPRIKAFATAKCLELSMKESVANIRHPIDTGTALLDGTALPGSLYAGQAERLNELTLQLEGPNGLANFYRGLSNFAENGESMADLVIPGWALLTDGWELIQDALIEGFEEQVWDQLSPELQKETEQGVGQATGSTAVVPGSEFAPSSMSVGSHSEMAGDFHGSKEEGTYHQGAWKSPLADTLSRKATAQTLDLVQICRGTNDPIQRASYLNALMSSIDGLMCHPEDNQEFWTSDLDAFLETPGVQEELNKHLV